MSVPSSQLISRLSNFPPLSVSGVLDYQAYTNPEKCAIYDDEKSFTYAELYQRVVVLSDYLLSRGIAKGDVIAAYLPNCIEYVIVVIAVARTGAIFTPINPRFKSFEARAILKQAEPVCIFTTKAQVKIVNEALEPLTTLRPIIFSVDDGATEKFFSGHLPPHYQSTSNDRPIVNLVEGDFFSLMFTSGTTGEPKGALATHRARMLWVLNALIQYGICENDVYLGTMPQTHSAGLTFTLMHLYAGATVRIMPQFDPNEYLNIVTRENISSSLTVPTMLTMIVEALESKGSAVSLGSLKRLVTCGSPLPIETKRRVLNQITPELFDYYGSTESNSMSILRPADQLRKPKSVGQAFRNVRLKTVKEDGSDCALEEVGEILCINPSAMTEYWRNPEATESAFSGSWYHTGDLGYLDSEGFLHLVGRKTDVVISGGFNIYAAEVEQILMMYPGVLDAAVVGVEDPVWGQRVKAFLVLREGIEVSLTDIQNHVSGYLADYKKPRELEFLSELPKNAGGKTMKAQLLESENV